MDVSLRSVKEILAGFRDRYNEQAEVLMSETKSESPVATTSPDMFWYKQMPFPAGKVTAESLSGVEGFPVRADDVFVSSYPKSGTTWTLELVSRILAAKHPEIDLELPLNERAPYFEFVHPKRNIPACEVFKEMASPRLAKTHLAYSLLPRELQEKRGRLIYIARNPKDVAVSFFFHYQASTFLNRSPDFPSFARRFLDGQVVFGEWLAHVSGYWAQRRHPRLLLLRYEDMKTDLVGEAAKIAEFLEEDLDSRTLATIVEQCSFTSMKENPLVNWSNVKTWNHEVSPFMRQGEVKDWLRHFDATLNREFEERIAARMAPELKDWLCTLFCECRES